MNPVLLALGLLAVSGVVEGAVSPEGKCGPRWPEKFECAPGNCCSKYGYCGTTPEYCATGNCIGGYGTCVGYVAPRCSAPPPPPPPPPPCADSPAAPPPMYGGGQGVPGGYVPPPPNNGGGYVPPPPPPTVTEPTFSTSTDAATSTATTATATSTPTNGTDPGGAEQLRNSTATATATTSTGHGATPMPPIPPAPAPPASGLPISTDGRCGAKVGKMCSGSCCSKDGWCGSTKDYCTAGCQAGFGLCGAQISGLTFDQCLKPGQFALTFDDGPDKPTAQILATLKQENVVATFFTLGQQVKSMATNAWKASLADMNHEIGSHSYSHPHFGTLTDAQAQKELDDTNAAILAATGHTPKFFRFPYGETSAFGMNYLAQHGMKFIFWNMDAKDYTFNTVQALRTAYQKTLANVDPAKDSFISLNHDISQVTADFLPELIAAVKAKGFQFVSMSECTGQPAYA